MTAIITYLIAPQDCRGLQSLYYAFQFFSLHLLKTILRHFQNRRFTAHLSRNIKFSLSRKWMAKSDVYIKWMQFSLLIQEQTLVVRDSSLSITKLFPTSTNLPFGRYNTLKNKWFKEYLLIQINESKQSSSVDSGKVWAFSYTDTSTSSPASLLLSSTLFR